MSTVLVIGDTHAPCMLEGYVDFLSDLRKSWGAEHVVHIGDVVDWGAISYHEKNPDCPGAGDEYRQALGQVAQLYKAFPRAVVMTGNHDDLPARQARTSGIPQALIRDYAKVWETPGWDWRPRYTTYVLEEVAYSHGDKGKGGMFAALKNAKENFINWVQGHLHSQAGVDWFANVNGLVFGMSVGCGVDRKKAAMDYGVKFNAKPIIGAGIVVDGRYAYFEPMRI